MISVHPLFFIMLLMWIGSGQISQYALVIGSLLWHELGHVCMMKWRGAKMERLVLLPFGGRLTLHRATSYQDRVWVAMGGPLFTLLAYIAGEGLPILWQQPWQQIQFVLLIINCLPIHPLDGGQIICNSLLTIYPKNKVYEAYISLSFYFLTIIVVVTLLMLPRSIILAVLSLLLWSEVMGEWKIRKYRSAYEKNVMNRLT